MYKFKSLKFVFNPDIAPDESGELLDVAKLRFVQVMKKYQELSPNIFQIEGGRFDASNMLLQTRQSTNELLECELIQLLSNIPIDCFKWLQVRYIEVFIECLMRVI